jgi:glycosyltransferase involved in cell wall biosynthesis
MAVDSLGEHAAHASKICGILPAEFPGKSARLMEKSQPHMSGTPPISIVIPVYNERDSLPPLLDELAVVLPRLGQGAEIVLVDDKSDDGTREWIRETASRRPEVRGVLLDRHEGQSAAFAAGFANARGDILITMDADGQNDPADLPALVGALANADVVSGVRAMRHDTWRRRVSSRFANRVRQMVLGDTITDVGCSLKAYRRSAIEGLPYFRGIHRYLPGFCQFRGARVIEIPVHHRARSHGRSKYGVLDRLWVGLSDLWGARWLKSRLIRARVEEIVHV